MKVWIQILRVFLVIITLVLEFIPALIVCYVKRVMVLAKVIDYGLTKNEEEVQKM